MFSHARKHDHLPEVARKLVQVGCARQLGMEDEENVLFLVGAEALAHLLDKVSPEAVVLRGVALGLAHRALDFKKGVAARVVAVGRGAQSDRAAGIFVKSDRAGPEVAIHRRLAHNGVQPSARNGLQQLASLHGFLLERVGLVALRGDKTHFFPPESSRRVVSASKKRRDLGCGVVAALSLDEPLGAVLGDHNLMWVAKGVGRRHARGRWANHRLF